MEFLELFKQRREELHNEIKRLNEALDTNMNYYGGNILTEKQKKEYLLILVNMFLFHAHILLRKTDDRKLVSEREKQTLKEYFFRLL